MTSPLVVKTSSEIVSDVLRTIRNGLIELGVSNPQVALNTDFGLVAQGVGNEVSVASNNASLLLDQGMPDSATGNDLDRLLAIYGLTRRAASTSAGLVVATASANSFVPTGAQLSDANGTRFQVSVGGTYGNGSQIPVASVDVGSNTNVDAGTVLIWATTPAFFAPTVAVSSLSPIQGGEDAETDDAARQRLINYLANPQGGGNPSQIIAWAQESDPSVQTAYVHPAARGSGTYDVCVIGYASSSDGYRNIDSLKLTNKIAPFILGNVPQFADGYVCTTVNYPMDVSIGLSLPSSPSSIPAGPGGGWLDASPLQVTSAKPAIRVVDGYALSSNDPAIPKNTATSFWVDFPVAPLNGSQYSISYLSPVTQTLYAATTTGSYTQAFGSLAAYTSLYYITINAPFYQNASNNTIIQPGNYVFPSAVNTSSYVAAFLAYVALLGPGERTNVPGLLPRANRLPQEQISGNYKLNSRALKPILETGPEVYDGALLFRGSYLNTGTTPTAAFVDYATLTTGSDPAFASYAPPTTYNQFATMVAPSFTFTLQNLGIYPVSI